MKSRFRPGILEQSALPGCGPEEQHLECSHQRGESEERAEQQRQTDENLSEDDQRVDDRRVLPEPEEQPVDGVCLGDRVVQKARRRPRERVPKSAVRQLSRPAWRNTQAITSRNPTIEYATHVSE